MACFYKFVLVFISLECVLASTFSEFYSLTITKPMKILTSKLNAFDLSLLSNGQDNSLISLTNQVGVDVLPAKYPILLKQHQKFQFLVEIVITTSEGKSISPENKSLVVNAPSLFASQLLREGRIDVLNGSSQCDSPFLSLDTDSLCSKIMFRKFASYARPWNHEIHVYLISKGYQIKDVNRIPDVWTDSNSQHRWKWKPKLTNKARLLIFESEPSWYGLNRYRQSLSSWVFHDNDILFVSTFAKLGNLRTKFTVFVPCQICRITFFVFLSLTSVGLEEIFNEVNTVYHTTVNITIWTLNEDFLPLKAPLLQHLNTNKRLSKNRLSVEQLLAHRINEMLISIFGSKNDDSDSKPRIEVIKYLGVDFKHVDFSMIYSPFNIRYIGCGDTFKIQRSYSVLLTSFDSYCWFSIAILIFLFAPITWSTLLNMHMYIDSYIGSNPQNILVLTLDAILAMVKNILEQSTPYPKGFTLNFQMKLVATSLLLGILVISNAYKNDSINTLISPVRFQPFKTFDDLVKYNYSILAELEHVWLLQDFPIKVGTILEYFESGLFNDNHSYEKPENFVGGFTPLHIDSIMKTFVQMLPLNLSVPRSVEKIYKNSFMKIDPLRTALGDKDTKYLISEENLTSILSAVKVTQSMNFLKHCNKSAVLAYEPQIREYEYQLRHHGLKKISVSSDVLLGSKIGFILHGWFPKFVLFRIKFVEQSGIVDWWNGFVLKHLVSVRAQSMSRILDVTETIKKDFSSSNKNGMSGNLLVLFVVYLLGCCIGFIFWCLEICWSFTKHNI